MSGAVAFPEEVELQVAGSAVLYWVSYEKGAAPTPVELKQMSLDRVVAAFDEKVISAHWCMRCHSALANWT